MYIPQHAFRRSVRVRHVPYNKALYVCSKSTLKSRTWFSLWFQPLGIFDGKAPILWQNRTLPTLRTMWLACLKLIFPLYYCLCRCLPSSFPCVSLFSKITYLMWHWVDRQWYYREIVDLTQFAIFFLWICLLKLQLRFELILCHNKGCRCTFSFLCIFHPNPPKWLEPRNTRGREKGAHILLWASLIRHGVFLLNNLCPSARTWAQSSLL